MSVETIGAATASTNPTQVAPNASANTKGSYVQLVASSAANSTGLMVVACPNSTSADYLIDIATGAAASETDIVSNLIVANWGNNDLFPPHMAYLPIKIASGTRVSARSQASGASKDLYVMAYLLTEETTFSNMSSCVTYGASTADSGGTSVDPGGTANTKGSWTEVTASTSADIDWLVVGVGSQQNSAPATFGTNWLIDIGTGGAGAETVIAANLFYRITNSSNSYHYTMLGPLPLAITSGTRIAVRAQCNTNDATDRLFDVVLYGFNGTAAAGGGGGAFFSAGFMG